MRIECNSGAIGAPRADQSVSRTTFFLDLRRSPEPRTRAELVPEQLASAWSAVLGAPALPRTIAILTAHWALETDVGRAMPGHNFAGIKAAPAARGAELRTVEGYGPARREVTARFRVYDSAEAGARDYVHLLATRFPPALEAARAGDATAFVLALAHGGYFTADPVAYSAGLQQRLRTLESGAPPAVSAAPPSLAQIALAGVLGALQKPDDDP